MRALLVQVRALRPGDKVVEWPDGSPGARIVRSVRPGPGPTWIVTFDRDQGAAPGDRFVQVWRPVTI